MQNGLFYFKKILIFGNFSIFTIYIDLLCVQTVLTL